MVVILAASIILGVIATKGMAQTGTIGLCTAEGCDYCPNNLLQQGTGYPKCVIYKTSDVLGAYSGDYSDSDLGKDIWYNIPEVSNPDCRTIIRTPADTDVKNCGYPLYAGQGGQCASIQTKDTLMVQFCCGVGDCSSAGAEKRSENGSDGVSLTSLVFTDRDGHLIVPHAVSADGEDFMEHFLYDFGLNSSNTVQTVSEHGVNIFKEISPVVERACDNYIPDGAPYTATGTESYVVSDYICGDDTSTTIQNTHSVSATTTFSTTVSDPFGIVSASISFAIEMSASQSYSYTFTPKGSTCGHVTWTPIYECTKGKITGCSEGVQYGDVCTAKRISSEELAGIYSFVQT